MSETEEADAGFGFLSHQLDSNRFSGVSELSLPALRKSNRQKKQGLLVVNSKESGL